MLVPLLPHLLFPNLIPLLLLLLLILLIFLIRRLIVFLVLWLILEIFELIWRPTEVARQKLLWIVLWSHSHGWLVIDDGHWRARARLRVQAHSTKNKNTHDISVDYRARIRSCFCRHLDGNLRLGSLVISGT